MPADVQGAWVTAFNAGDEQALLATYAEDTVLYPPNGPRVIGHDGVKAIFGEGLKQGFTATQTTDALEVRDDTGFRAGAFTLMDPAGAELDRGKYIELWRKDAQGVWKMTHDMWNSDKPAVPSPDPVAQ